jgi:hypothetical protein
MAGSGRAPDPAVTLERYCRRLLMAYPADFRARRGDELVATMIEVTTPGRRRPRLADALDLVASGLRCRIAAATPAGLESGLAMAAPVGLAVAAGISLFAWWRVEPMGAHTVGPIAYGAWLLAAASRLLSRPRLSRVLVAVAIAITLVLPAVAAAVGLDRPPLWVLMALSAFGLLVLAGTAPRVGAAGLGAAGLGGAGVGGAGVGGAGVGRATNSNQGTRDAVAGGGGGSAGAFADDRLAVPAGAVAVAVCASTVTRIWPASGDSSYYYQPTIARVGAVVAAAVAVLAIISVIRLVRGANAQPWLWATALLGLPAGWFGPFDSAGLRTAADQAVPQFGRLAQVLLASSVAVIAMAWLSHRRAPGAPVHRVPGRDALAAAGWGMAGCAAALAAFTAATGSGLVGFAGRPWQAGIPRHALVTLAALGLAGLCGIVVRPGHLRSPVPVAAGLSAGFAPTALAAWLVAAYDNGWTAGRWGDFAHTTGLVMTLAFVPFTYGVIVAARALTRRGGPSRSTERAAALGMLAVSVGWIGYVTVPYVPLWGPGLVVVAACCVVVAVSSRRGTSSAGTPG